MPPNFRNFVLLLKTLSAIFGVLALVGCIGGNSAINRTENYAQAWPNIQFESKNTILVGTVDKRLYVTSRDKNENFVGLMRGGFGNPFDMYTESKQPLAVDITAAITAGLLNAGINANQVALGFANNKSEITGFINNDNFDKKLLIKINEWKSDTYSRSRFLFDLDVSVYDEKGAMLASASTSNLDDKGEHSSVSTLDAGRNALTSILNKEQIKKALQ